MIGRAYQLFIINVNVLFLNNSQLTYKKGDEKFRPLDSFHNGIILIVNCLKSDAKIRFFFHTHKYFFQKAHPHSITKPELAFKPLLLRLNSGLIALAQGCPISPRSRDGTF